MRKRKFSNNVLQNAPNCTINKHSGEYAPILLNIVRNNTIYIIYIYVKMSIFTFFWTKLHKIVSKTHQIENFTKILAPEPT